MRRSKFKSLASLILVGALVSFAGSTWAKGPHGGGMRSCPRYSGECPRYQSGSASQSRYKYQHKYQYRYNQQNDNAQMDQRRYRYQQNSASSDYAGDQKAWKRQWRRQNQTLTFEEEGLTEDTQ